MCRRPCDENYHIIIIGRTISSSYPFHASKSILLPLERAQRAILKVATFRPFRFPTHQLYSECKVLTVRQLFILNIVLLQHTEISFSPVPTGKRRKDLVCTIPQTKHAFTNRFYLFLGPYLYNKLNRLLKVYSVSLNRCNIMVTEYLQSLNYSDTEKLLEVLQ